MNIVKYIEENSKIQNKKIINALCILQQKETKENCNKDKNDCNICICNVYIGYFTSNDKNYKRNVHKYLTIKYIRYLCIKLVRGSINFLPSLGSRGVNAPNWKYNIMLHSRSYLEKMLYTNFLSARLTSLMHEMSQIEQILYAKYSINNSTKCQ